MMHAYILCMYMIWGACIYIGMCMHIYCVCINDDMGCMHIYCVCINDEMGACIYIVYV